MGLTLSQLRAFNSAFRGSGADLRGLLSEMYPDSAQGGVAGLDAGQLDAVIQRLNRMKRERTGKDPLEATAEGKAPLVLIDKREKKPWVFTRFPTRVALLRTGDYTIEGFEHRFVIERKSVADLVHSVTADNARFWEEIERMRGCPSAHVVVEGPMDAVKEYVYERGLTPAQVFGVVNAIQARTGVKVAFLDSREGAQEYAQEIIRHYCGGIHSDMKRLQKALVPFTPN